LTQIQFPIHHFFAYTQSKENNDKNKKLFSFFLTYSHVLRLCSLGYITLYLL